MTYDHWKTTNSDDEFLGSNKDDAEKYWHTLEMALAQARDEIEQLRSALEESVTLQSHYASLLNMHDGGTRLMFSDANAWLVRLQTREL